MAISQDFQLISHKKERLSWNIISRSTRRTAHAVKLLKHKTNAREISTWARRSQHVFVIASLLLDIIFSQGSPSGQSLHSFKLHPHNTNYTLSAAEQSKHWPPIKKSRKACIVGSIKKRACIHHLRQLLLSNTFTITLTPSRQHT